jgi:Domain of unknown function (DUF4926)
MERMYANDRVRLESDLPALELSRGEPGRVVSTWFYPNTAYEVEFEARPSVSAYPVRVLLLSGQIRRE